VDRAKSYQVVVLCIDYPSQQTVTCGYEVLFSLIPLLSLLVRNYIILSPCHGRSCGQTQILSSRCIAHRLPESSNGYMWLRSTFLTYPTTFLICKRTVSSCLLAIVEVVDRTKSYQVDVLCAYYPSHQTVTCGYEVLFYIIPLLCSLVENYIILSPCHNRSSGQTEILSSRCIVRRLTEPKKNYMWLRSTFLSDPATFLVREVAPSFAMHWLHPIPIPLLLSALSCSSHN
jgi:hypothetical protein